MGSGIDKEELRQLVRDVLRSSLPGGANAAASHSPGNLIEAIRQAILPGGSGVATVAADLDAFAREIVNAAAHEDLKAAIMTSRVTFKRKDDGPGQAQNRAPAIKGGQFRIDKGMLNEMRIAEIGKQYSRVLVGPEVVVTPLARDRARELKLELVRTKP
jgi:hypothetical protein